MNFVWYLTFIVFLTFNNLSEIEARGRLMNPINRCSAFRNDSSAPKDRNDDGNRCVGLGVRLNNEEKLGVCGDNYTLPQPRPNENGGKYGRGVIAETYQAGARFVANVEIITNKLGYFEFALCPLNNETELETEECFDKHKIQRVGGGHKYSIINPKKGQFLVLLSLPQGLTCKHCVIRWQYTTGIKWGCPDGTVHQDCGSQETFRTCSDIKIQ